MQLYINYFYSQYFHTIELLPIILIKDNDTNKSINLLCRKEDATKIV